MIIDLFTFSHQISSGYCWGLSGRKSPWIFLVFCAVSPYSPVISVFDSSTSPIASNIKIMNVLFKVFAFWNILVFVCFVGFFLFIFCLLFVLKLQVTLPQEFIIIIIIIIMSCRITDIPEPLSPLLPIVHRLWQVFKATSRILTLLLYVCSWWSSWFCPAICVESIGVHHLCVRPCFCSNVLHVWFV